MNDDFEAVLNDPISESLKFKFDDAKAVLLSNGQEKGAERAGKGTGSVVPFSQFTPERKKRFIELAKQYWPNMGEICRAVGVSRWTVANHRKSDPIFNNALHEIDQQVCDDHEMVMRANGMTPKGFLDRMAYLRAHRPELYDRAKVVKIEGYKMENGERQRRLGAVETVIDAEVVKTYSDRKQRRELKQQARLKAGEAAGGEKAGGAE